MFNIHNLIKILFYVYLCIIVNINETVELKMMSINLYYFNYVINCSLLIIILIFLF